MTLFWILALILGAAAISDFLLRRYAKHKIADMFENVPPFSIARVCQNPEAKLLTIQSPGKPTLSGSLQWPAIEKPLGLVIFFPELNGNHWMAAHYCEGLLRSGFAVLGFDFRNQGQSESVPDYSPIHWLTEFELDDVSAVLEFIESDPQLSTMSLFAFGVSRGGVAALIAGSRYPRIRAVVADSAFGTVSMMRHYVDRFVKHVIPRWFYAILPSWHVAIALKQGLLLSQTRRKCQYLHLENEASGLAQTAVLLISGKRDTYVSPGIASELQTLIGANCHLWLVDGAKHNMARSVATAEYDAKVASHLMQALGIEQARSQTVASNAAT